MAVFSLSATNMLMCFVEFSEWYFFEWFSSDVARWRILDVSLRTSNSCLDINLSDCRLFIGSNFPKWYEVWWYSEIRLLFNIESYCPWIDWLFDQFCSTQIWIFKMLSLIKVYNFMDFSAELEKGISISVIFFRI